MSHDFKASELIAAIEAQGLKAVVWQSGGGTATLDVYSETEPNREKFLVGPGSYDWNNPAASEFTTDELYFGLDTYGPDDEVRDVENFEVTPGTDIQEAGRQIAAKYREMTKP